jgi:hypothetical protein
VHTPALRYGADPQHAECKRAKYKDAEFKCAEYEYAEFKCAEYKDAEFECAEFKCAKFKCAEYKVAKFKCAKYKDAIFKCAEYKDVEFECAEFKCAKFKYADTQHANPSRCRPCIMPNFQIAHVIKSFRSPRNRYEPTLSADITIIKSRVLLLQGKIQRFAFLVSIYHSKCLLWAFLFS